VQEAAAAVLGDIFGVNYTIDPKIDGRVSLQTTKETTREGIAELFQASLRHIGAALVQTGNVYRIVTADQAAQGAMLGGEGASIGSALRVVPLRYIAAPEMKRILDPIAQFGGVVRVDTSRNSLILSGTDQELAAMQEAISVFDVNVMRGMSFAIVPVRGVEPDAILEDLNKIFGTAAEGPMAGMVQFIPNKRLRTVLVMSKQPEYLEEAQRWVRRLDEQASGTRRQLYTYMVRNRQATELVEVLNSIFAKEINTGESGRGRAEPPPLAPATPVNASVGGFSVFGGAPIAAGAVGGTSFNPDRFEDVPGRRSSDPPGPGTGQATASTAFGAGGADTEARIKIVADAAQNALLILAADSDYKRVERAIASLDVVPNQVLIEATIAEVTLNDSLRLGVRWFFQDRGGNHAGTFTGSDRGALGSVFPGFSYVFRSLNVRATINALNDVSRVNVLASPSLMVLDKKTATLQIGDQVPITTQSAVSVITPGAPIVNSVSYKDTGVILSVTPRVNESGRVLLDIEQEVSTVSRTTSSDISSPTFGRRRVKTTVVVNDGEGITLGGLIHDRTTEGAAQVPVLGDIPIIGNAFKEKRNIVEKTELLIMLTPRVVRDLNEAQAVTAEYRNKIESFTPTKNPGRKILHNISRTVQ
jgi:general secretion pathway protein D